MRMKKKVLLSACLFVAISVSAQTESQNSTTFTTEADSLQEGTAIEEFVKSHPEILISEGTVILGGPPRTIPTGKRAITPQDRGIITEGTYLEKLLEYAPEGFVCGYIMRNAWNRNLWGIFLVKEKNKYSLVYKESDNLEERKIKSDVATVLETSVNERISKIEFDVNNPVFVEVPVGLPEATILYEGDVAFAVTPSKAAHFRASSFPGSEYLGIKDEYWQAERDRFKQEDK